VRGATLQTEARAHTPQAARRAFVAALNRGDLEGASACFARNGCMVTPDATTIHGREAIGALLTQLIDRRTEIEVRLSDRLEAAEATLAAERWKIASEGVDGRSFVRESIATLVLCRVEGEWKLSILAPWGWGT